MKKFFLSLICALLSLGAWATEETVTFTNKDWAPWTNVTSGSSFESTNLARGVANNAVNGSCKSTTTYSNVNKIEVVCSSNTTGGKVAISIGSYQIANKIVAQENDQTLTFDNSDNQNISTYTGLITLSVTKNSKTVYVKSVTITYGNGEEQIETYNVNVASNIIGGSVSTNATSAAAGAEVTLTATPATGYEFGSWNVTNATTSAAITVTNNKFTMPAANVNVSATFNQIQQGGDEGDGITYNFADMSDFSSWGSSYEKKTTTFSDGAYVELASANKNTQTITDCPVTKGGDVIFKAPAGKTITSLTFTCTQWTTKAQTITLHTSSNGTSYTATNTTSSNFVLSATNLSDVKAVKFTFSSTSNQVGIKSIKVTYAESGDPQKTTPALSFTNPTYNATMEETFVAPTLTNEQGVAVTYSSSAEAVATVNATTGAVTLVAPGTTTITASFAGNNTYNEASASYELVVAPAPFTSLEALVAADLTSGTNVTVSFENVAIKEIYVTTPRNEGDPVYRNGIFFNIQKGGKDIEIYYQNVPAEWVAGGTVSGTLTNCPWKNFNGTWELAPEKETWAWTNLTYTAPTKNTPTITATYATELTVGNTANVFEVNYNGDGELSVGSSEEGVATAVIDEEGTVTVTPVAAGTTVITISASETDNYYAAELTYTLTVNKAPFVPTPAAEGYETVDFAALYSSITTNANVEDYEGTSFAMAFAKPQSSTTPTKYYDNGKAVRAYTGNTITITGAENIVAVDIAWAPKYIDDAVSITGLETTTAVVTFSKNCRFTAITVNYASYEKTIAEGAIGYYTICLPYAATPAEDAIYYNIAGVNKNGETITGVVLEEVEGNLVAGTPYIVEYATAGTYTSYKRSASVSAAVETEGLVGNIAAENLNVPLGAYVIGDDNKFHKVTGNAVYVRQYSAYLTLADLQETATAGRKVISIVDETTAVENVEATTAVKFYENGVLYIQKNGRVYNAMGQLVK